jgi:hypothetical protein
MEIGVQQILNVFGFGTKYFGVWSGFGFGFGADLGLRFGFGSGIGFGFQICINFTNSLRFCNTYNVSFLS